MNRKLEDLIVRKAFGDLTPAEEAQLQAQLDVNPELGRMAETYQHLRNDLRSLSAVPEHQLSNERLRTAILERGLDCPKPARNWAWLWMPAAACSLAFGLAYARTLLPNSSNPTVVAMNTDATPIAPLEVPIAKIIKPVRATGVDKAASATIQTAGYEPSKRIRRKRKPVAPAVSNEPSDGAILAMQAIPQMFDANPSSNAPVRATEAEEPVVKTADYVVIEGERDTQTGAQAATEVANFGHVVVGG